MTTPFPVGHPLHGRNLHGLPLSVDGTDYSSFLQPGVPLGAICNRLRETCGGNRIVPRETGPRAGETIYPAHHHVCVLGLVDLWSHMQRTQHATPTPVYRRDVVDITQVIVHNLPTHTDPVNVTDSVAWTAIGAVWGLFFRVNGHHVFPNQRIQGIGHLSDVERQRIYDAAQDFFNRH